MDFDVNLGTSTYENGPLQYDDFPRTDEPVFMLGEHYSALLDREQLKDDIQSRIWFTYRKGFHRIGGTGPDSDNGWGCMLRCGQMMLAQALVVRHLGRSWRWRPEVQNDVYWKLLRMFEDKKMSTYSIHQIASMGEAEGKAIGQWFGPNTIAQVIKRISVYDDWSDIVIHVALDNVVIQNDIRKQCISSDDDQSSQVPEVNGDSAMLPDGESFSYFVNEASKNESPKRTPGKWKPLMLIIPLRLGLTDINPIYFESLKKCFSMRQSIGIIGGKPNHAHYFIGYVGNELIYLDPHTTQLTVDLEEQRNTDDTYHCLTPPSRMSFHKLDPSIALGFYCHTEDDFENLCEGFRINEKSCQSMFEVRKEAPKAWPYDDSVFTKVKVGSGPGTSKGVSLSDFQFISDNASTTGSSVDDEEFEMLMPE